VRSDSHHGPDFAVLENRASVIRFLDGNIQHCPRQIVSAKLLGALIFLIFTRPKYVLIWRIVE